MKPIFDEHKNVYRDQGQRAVVAHIVAYHDPERGICLVETWAKAHVKDLMAKAQPAPARRLIWDVEDVDTVDVLRRVIATADEFLAETRKWAHEHGSGLAAEGS